ncbi:MAG: response regulator [Bacteroidota bacterium]
MENPIHILHLEDRQADSILIKSEISKGFTSFEYFFTDNETDFLNILKEKKIDIVLSDYSLPDYSGTDALLVIKSKYPQIPFIFVSGVMGEDAAIDSLLNGAVDYVLKTKLKRLVPAISRALREAELLHKQKFADAERRKLFRAVEQSSVSVQITDVEGNIEYVNPKTCETTGYTREELIGKNPRIFQSGEVPIAVYKNLWDTIASGKKWHGEFHNKKKNGELFWESFAISPVFDSEGKITNYVAIKEDITKQIEMISELKAAKEKAEADDRLKTAFIHNISHEIRTPLNGILGFAKFVIQPDISEDEKNIFLEILNTSSERLINTITNYMDISLIVTGNIVVKFRPVDLPLLLNDIYQKFYPKSKAKNLEFIKEIPSDINKYSLQCDASLLGKAISHLVDNAIKFTNFGSVIMGFHIVNNEYEIFVKDTGEGIATEAQSRVFEVFMQEEVSETREFEGSGLGLSIAKGMIEILGGRIRIESTKDKGSTVIFALPAEPGIINKIESSIHLNPKSEWKKSPVVLVAEDNNFNTSFYKAILKKASFNFLQAVNGLEAVEMCLNHPEISIVLMDIKMPVMNGLEAIRKIREFRQNLPIIIITALTTTADMEKAFEAGCDEYITKPVDFNHLLSSINNHLNN